MVDFANPLLGESPAFEAHGVQPISASIARTHSRGEGKDVFCRHGAAADVGVRTDAGKLMHRGECSNHRPLTHADVPGKRGGVDQHRVVAHGAVVAYMRVCQHEYVAAQRGESAALRGPTIDRHILAKNIVVANLYSGRLSGIGRVLRLRADAAKREEAVVRANLSRTMDYYMRHQLAVLAQFHAFAENAVRANRAGRRHFYAGSDNCGGMNHSLGSDPGVFFFNAVHYNATDSGFGHELAVDKYFARHASGNALPHQHLDLDTKLVAGNHGPSKAGAFNAGKNHQLAVAVFNLGQQQRCSGLGHGFDDQDPWHNRRFGKVADEERLVGRDILKRHNPLAPVDLHYAVQQQKRIAVRQNGLDLLDVERTQGLRARGFGCVYSLTHGQTANYRRFYARDKGLGRPPADGSSVQISHWKSGFQNGKGNAQKTTSPGRGAMLLRPHTFAGTTPFAKTSAAGMSFDVCSLQLW